jgi:hypothetical protein
LYQLLADAIVVAHFLFIVFVIGGGFLVIFWPRLVWLHLPAAIWGAVIEFTGWICPLTPLENHFRKLGGKVSYTGDFVAQYLLAVIYPENLTADIQYILGGLVIAINVIFYVLAIRRYRYFSKVCGT